MVDITANKLASQTAGNFLKVQDGVRCIVELNDEEESSDSARSKKFKGKKKNKKKSSSNKRNFVRLNPDLQSLLLPPDVDKIESQEYLQQTIQSMMEGPTEKLNSGDIDASSED